MTIGLFLAYAIPIAFLVVLLLGSILSLAFVQRYLPDLLLAYLAIHFVFPGSVWGAEEFSRPIYSRGSGQLFLSFVNWSLIGFYLISVFVDRWRNQPAPVMTLRPYFMLFNIMFLGHLLVANYLDVPFRNSAGGGGILYVTMMTILVLLMGRTIREPKDLDRLGKVFLLAILGHGLFGLVRFAFFGGDPVNPYENYERLSVKLVFFDINDSLLATMAMVYALWKLGWSKGMANRERAFYWLIVVVEVAVVLFSYRRTGWIGMGIALTVIMWFLPWAMRWLMAAAVSLAIPVILLLNRERFSSGGGTSEYMGLIHSLTGQTIESGTRSAEWAMALDTIRNHVFLGAGSWGELGQGIITWHFGAYNFVHSAILHLWMKTGLLGLGLFLAAMVAWVVFLIRLMRTQSRENLALVVVGMAGVLFMLPSFVAGTPTIEWRTMQLFGFALALPYVVHNVSSLAGRTQHVTKPV